ncbi:hypothetical protein BU23DRAFT_293488 [Bimuria novae-zelandiae CBS 107.79]|uniref:Uncharacterized protein n=1 Tax=Bimuria novae-zelandiae CBS 107.79 TaxID=1447943 RepID=A0A6A5UR22_9PLEO|nr:hypothetical protein BU23DRAFT_293488 [Bimuria novae-zelandiae CBS 107.79]
MPPRPNTDILFNMYDTSTAPLHPNPSPLKPAAWRAALAHYPGTLGGTLYEILTHGARIGYTGEEAHIISKNLASAFEAPQVIEVQLAKDLTLGRAGAHSGQSPFISSPLGLVPKADGGWRRIHHLSFPQATSVNDNIPTAWGEIRYITIEPIFAHVRNAGRGQ